jgi:chemosensory pili system protein ChpA (sensor histidine kinase/response regulator)
MIRNELLEFFLTEAEEHIGILEKGFLELEQNPSDSSNIHELFRTAHTLKGSAALVKLNTLSEIAHKMEDVLESVRDSQLTINKDIVDWCLHSLDAIKFLISETVNERPEKVELIDEVSSALQCVLSEQEEEQEASEIKEDVVGEEIAESADHKEEAGLCEVTSGQGSDAVSDDNEEIAPGLYEEPVQQDSAAMSVNTQEADDPGELEADYEEAAQDTVEKERERRALSRRKDDLDKMSNFVKVHVEDLEQMMGLVGELTILKNFFVTETEGVSGLKTEINYACKRLLKELDDFNSNYAHSAPEKITIMDPLLEEFRELEFDRYDGINLFVNNITETTNDVTEAIKSISGFFNQFSKHVARLDKLNMEFRDVISESRMVETGKLFQRFTRIIRDLSNKSGKQVNLYVRGSQTRIDKILYERLFNPLLHLVRNAFSHGVESLEDRHERKKPDEGSIVLSAKRDGNSVIIDIQDDGQGINLKKVYSKAVSIGMIAEGEKVSQARLLNMLFMPGFSTQDKTDMTSGRGVGLDAVRQIISDINGTISIATEEGKGTIFRIRLPLSLIVVNTVKFKAGGLEFSVPSIIIKELIDIAATDYYKEKGSVKLGDEEVPAKDLCNLLNLTPLRTSKRLSVIVFNLLPGKETTLIVDEITAMEDTVIKPLGGFLEGLKYFSGTGISADGKLVPVINPFRLLEVQSKKEEIQQVSEAEAQGNTVLIVDDSLSVRKFAGMILEQKGYNVLTAPNGLEALNVIEDHNVDLIITDLEMPVMHGYELLRELKRRGLSEFVPTLVLSSRSNEKHKEKAIHFGARDYIVKPFEDYALCEIVKKHLKGVCPAAES